MDNSSMEYNKNTNYFWELNNNTSIKEYDTYDNYIEAKKTIKDFESIYKDPDAESAHLYNDLLKTFFTSRNLGAKRIVNKYKHEYAIKYNNFELHSDYIGPSRAWAVKAGLCGKEILEYISETRVLGGHMLWPVKYNDSNKSPNDSNKSTNNSNVLTINQARSGRNGYKDRFDLTLFAIKKWYEAGGNSEKAENFNNSKLKNALNNKKNKQWLLSDIFQGENRFETFIKFFDLQDFVDEKNLDVYDLTKFWDGSCSENNKSGKILENDDDKDESEFPIEHDEFIQYVRANSYCIKKRNIRLFKR